VFRNLIDNARSFSPPYGEVRLSLLRDNIDERAVHVVVEDDGPGIPPENLETVFERFYTSRPRARPSGPTPASACRSCARSSRRTAARSEAREPSRRRRPRRRPFRGRPADDRAGARRP
jgi:hypothetical protein